MKEMRDRVGEVWEDRSQKLGVIFLILSSRLHKGDVYHHDGLILASQDPEYHEGKIEPMLIEQLRPWEKEQTLERLA